MVKKINVTGAASFKYLREQLEMGQTLSHKINTILIERGTVYSYVTAETSERQLYKFNEGGIYPFDQELIRSGTAAVPVRNDARPIIIEEIAAHLKSAKMNCCLFENPVARASDPSIKSSPVKYIHLNGEVYYFFDDDPGKNEIENTVITSEDYVFLCVLSSLDINRHADFAAFKEMSIELLESFVQNVTSFFVRAYDGEGYLMWHRD